MRILVTGFDPFGSERINPASEVLKELPETIAGAEVHTLVVPTVFYKSIEVIHQSIKEIDPDVIVSVGQAGGRAPITVERIGINVDDARIADNIGQKMIDVPVVENGPAAYFSTLPIKAMVKAMQDAGVEASVSNTAGTFVCNHVMYGVLHLCATLYPDKRAGFVHIPFLPEQTKDKPQYPSMELKTIAKGLIAGLEAIVFCEKDISVTGGREH